MRTILFKIIILYLVYSSITISTFAQEVSPFEKNLLKKITTSQGPMLSKKKYPVLYTNLIALFNRLEVAHRKAYKESRLIINKIYILKSQKINAFVYPIQEEGIRRNINMVFVTTGLLSHLYKTQEGFRIDNLSYGTKMLAGILAHELAHPYESYDGNELSKKFGNASSQAVEIKADTYAIEILKKAGLAIDSLYEALLKISKINNNNLDEHIIAKIANAGSSTHPDLKIRLATQRLLMTMDRYNYGEHLPQKIKNTSISVVKELIEIDKTTSFEHFPQPKNLLDAFDSFNKINEEINVGLEKQRKLFKLQIIINKFLMTKKLSLTDKEYEMLLEFNEKHLTDKFPGNWLPLKNNIKRISMNETNTSQKFIKTLDHRDFINSIPTGII